MTENPAFATIGELCLALRRQEISPLQLIEVYAARIEHLQASSKAFISLDLDNARRKAGMLSHIREDAPLSGIPYSCKDLFDVSGIATTAGSRVLQDNIASQDAVAISRMDAAGGIFIGKNNLHEFAYGATGENSLYGTAPNPYDATRLAGGSSSGSAAAVALGLCAAALGTDTGGSVRAPAALCGLVGFKPTLGRISTEGVIPFCWSLDHVGTLTRSAADAALMFAVLADNFQAASQVKLEGLRIGIPETFFFERCDSEILDSVDGLMNFLRASGAILKPVTMPSMEFARTVALTVQMPEALSYHSRYLETRGEYYSVDFRAGLALGQSLLAEHYVRAKRFMESYRRDMDGVFAEIDFLLTPATPTIAPKIGASEVIIDGHAEPAGNAITRYTTFFNLTGQPAITLPCGMHSQGLPIAAQLVARPYQDEALLQAAIAIQSSYGFKPPLPNN